MVLILRTHQTHPLTKAIEYASEHGFRGIRLFDTNFKLSSIQVQATGIRTVLEAA